VQRIQDTGEGGQPKQDDAGRESQSSRCLMAHPELPFIDYHSMTLWERRRVALCRGSLA
jgi:hypothetical protein